MARTALVLRHVPYEGLAGFAEPIAAAGYRITEHDVADGLPAQAFRTADLVVALGGPMAVYEAATYPWIAPEIALLAARIAAGAPTLGICLGSQLIAAALGARVFAGPVKEVGFAPVRLLPAGDASPLRHLAGVPVLHWHGDSFALPDGVERLAETDHYPNQAFARGHHLLALQFHPEMGLDTGFERWLDGQQGYAAAAGTSIPALRQDYRVLGPAAAAAGRRLVDEWLAGLPD